MEKIHDINIPYELQITGVFYTEQDLQKIKQIINEYSKELQKELVLSPIENAEIKARIAGLQDALNAIEFVRLSEKICNAKTTRRMHRLWKYI